MESAGGTNAPGGTVKADAEVEAAGPPVAAGCANPAALSARLLLSPGGNVAEASTRSIRARRESVASVSRLPACASGGTAAAGTAAEPDVGVGDWIVSLIVGARRRRVPHPSQFRKPRSSAWAVTTEPQRGHLGTRDIGLTAAYAESHIAARAFPWMLRRCG